MSDKYLVELIFIKNPAPILDLYQEKELEDTLYHNFIKFVRGKTPKQIETYWLETSPIIAKISKIDNFGKVTVTFDKKV